MVAPNASQQGNPTYGGVPILISPVQGAGFPMWSTPGLPNVQSIDFEGQKASYVFSTASMQLATAPSDIIQINGAASIVTRVKHVRVQINSTVSGALNMSLVRRSTGSTGGTSASGTVNKYDTADATASTTVTTFTANPGTTGTTAATLISFLQPVNAAATPQAPISLYFGDDNLKSIVLRGALDFLVLNGNLSTLTNADNKMTCSFEFSEEASGS